MGKIAMEQLSFSSLVYENKKEKTRRAIFLQDMGNVIPWKLQAIGKKKTG